MGRAATNIRTLVKRTIESTTKSWNGFPCLEWTGSLDRDGYARVSVKNKMYRVSRLIASLYLNFDLKSSLLICHHCDNPKCIEHRHFFIGTPYKNTRDSINKDRHKTFPNAISHNKEKVICIRGHNNWRYLGHRRYCITCMKLHNDAR